MTLRTGKMLILCLLAFDVFVTMLMENVLMANSINWNIWPNSINWNGGPADSEET